MHEISFLRRLAERHAIIIAEQGKGCQTYGAYPYGDRRRRAISWIDGDMLKTLLASGAIAQTQRGFEIVSSAAARAKSEGPSPHAAQHRDIAQLSMSGDDGAFRPVTVNRVTRSPLDRLARMQGEGAEPLLTKAQLEAADQLARDYARSTLSVGITQNYENVGGGGGQRRGPEDASIAAIDARRRYLDALAYVGPGLDRPLAALCCHHRSLEQIERDEGWVRKSGATLIRLGLARLVVHYGTQAGPAAPRCAYPAPSAKPASR